MASNRKGKGFIKNTADWSIYASILRDLGEVKKSIEQNNHASDAIMQSW
ncbi:MAG: hypothetical protein IPH94_19195 [Saprospiraceae bacterium]|nr:hypothetical protein [Saprospiraceae bacterium]